MIEMQDSWRDAELAKLRKENAKVRHHSCQDDTIPHMSAVRFVLQLRVEVNALEARMRQVKDLML